MKKLTIKSIISLIAIGLICAILIAGNIICYTFNEVITGFLCGGGSTLGTGALAESDELCREIEKEGIVLLKNGNVSAGKKSLPLSADLKKVNVFGWGATDAGFVTIGVGSGSSPIYKEHEVTFLGGLKEAGIEYNTEIINAYEDFYKGDLDSNGNYRREWDRNTAEVYRLYEPSKSWYTRTMMANAQSFSDTALIMISRISGENTSGEVPTTQNRLYTENGKQATDSTRTYLDLTKYEEDLIDLCYENFSNIVLIVNSSNTMHLGDAVDKVNSVISVGVAGQSGGAAIPQVLWGKDKDGNAVNPSGRLASTHTYEPTTDAAYANHDKASNQIQYLEDIYVGYKWYETADAEGFWDSEFAKNKWGITKGYEDVVQYPFGYGLSYTEFEWEVKNLAISNGATLSKDSKITFDVSVKNVGTMPGKDVIEVYANLPYKKGGIEKSASKLVAFFKTPELPADNKTWYTETVTVDLYELASYDCYDKNDNKFFGYEMEYVEGKDYQIKIMTDAHTLKDCATNVINYKVPTSGIKFETDPVTGVKVENRLTGDTAYAGVPIDGSTVGAETKYLTRNDFAGTFPVSHAKTPSNSTLINQAAAYLNPVYNQDTMPVTGVENNLRLFKNKDGSNPTSSQLGGKEIEINEELAADLADYDSTTWEAFINQMTPTELDTLTDGKFETKAIVSIGKVKILDRDGPAGINEVILGHFNGKENWTAFPGEVVIACTWNVELAYQLGLSVGKEGQNTSISGWYAPTANLYRSAYNGRNYESYSEDGFLSGKFASKQILGAKTSGMYCYMKHFVLSELGVNPLLVKTWITEQNLRENYLKPFEIAVKEGEANAIMSSFNSVGGVWAGANYATLTQILRNEWGFKGSVITDYVKTGMTGKLGIRAGNDLWLGTSGLSTSDPTEMYCAKMAAKNILYTYVSTYQFAKNNDPEFTVKLADAVYPWWIPLLIGIDVVAVLGCGVWAFFVLFFKKKSKVAEVIAE